MIRYKLISSVILFIFLTMACQHGQPMLSETERVDIKEAILAVNNNVIEAAKHADLETMFTSIAENNEGVIIRNGELFKTKDEAYRSYQQSFQNVEKVEYVFNQQYVNVLSRELAYLSASGESVVTINDGRVFQTPFAQTSIFVKQGDEWKVLHTHASSPIRQ